ncbi:hypothetical protein EMCRGX_G034879 [Ephydatia muelleri]|eukprot:Em0023g772a
MNCANREPESYGSKNCAPASTPPPPGPQLERVTQPPPSKSNLAAPVKPPSSGNDVTSSEGTVRQSQCAHDDREERSRKGTDVTLLVKDSGETLSGKRPAPAVTIKLGAPKEAVPAKKAKVESVPTKPSASGLVAKAFGSDSEEEEEMPPEAKLRMRNIGKNTPTSAGPNSFNKTATGFSNPKGSWRKGDDDDGF